MDSFGIGQAMKGMAHMYFHSARGTGRTMALVESLKDGDRVIFTNSAEAARVKDLCRELGKTIETMVVDPVDPARVFERGTPQGRTVFDHSWVEQFYLVAIDACQKDIDRLQRESSGFGMAHVETRMKARELAKWRV